MDNGNIYTIHSKFHSEMRGQGGVHTNRDQREKTVGASLYLGSMEVALEQ